jgi:hypothetical protein
VRLRGPLRPGCASFRRRFLYRRGLLSCRPAAGFPGGWFLGPCLFHSVAALGWRCVGPLPLPLVEGLTPENLYTYSKSRSSQSRTAGSAAPVAFPLAPCPVIHILFIRKELMKQPDGPGLSPACLGDATAGRGFRSPGLSPRSWPSAMRSPAASYSDAPRCSADILRRAPKPLHRRRIY